MSPRQQSMDTGEVYDTKKLIDVHDEVMNSLTNTDSDNNTVHWTYDRLYLAETAETHQVHCQVSS